MNLYLFQNCKDFKEVKSKYRNLCKEYHPDKNADIDIKLIQELNNQYDYIEKHNIKYPILDKKVNDKEKNKTYQYNKNVREDENKKYKETTTYKYKEAQRKKDNELTELIKTAYTTILINDFNKASLYYQFIEYIESNNIRASKSHFELIGKLLKYKDGWAFYKYEEYTQKLNTK